MQLLFEKQSSRQVGDQDDEEDEHYEHDEHDPAMIS